MYNYIRFFLFFLAIFSPPFFNLPTYSIYLLVFSCFFAYDFLSNNLLFKFSSYFVSFFIIAVSLFILCFFFNYFDNYFHDMTSVLFAFLIVFSFLSPSLSSFFSNILNPPNKNVFIKCFFYFSLLITVPSILQFLRLDFGLFDSGYSADLLAVKISGYRFPGFMNMYGALASTVYATYITFFLFVTRSSSSSTYLNLCRFISLPLLLFCLLFCGSTGLFALLLYFLIFNFRSFLVVLFAAFLSSPILLSIPSVAKTSASYLLKILSFDPNINLFTDGTLGYLLSMYFGERPDFIDYLPNIPMLGGLPNFYQTGLSDIGYFNLIGVYSIFSIILFYSLIIFFLYSLRNGHYLSYAIYLSIICILINFKEVYFLSSPGAFRLLFILSLASLSCKVSSAFLSSSISND